MRNPRNAGRKENPLKYQAPKGMRRCLTCKEVKHMNQFHKQRSCVDGIYPTCGRCRTKQQYQRMMLKAYDAGDKSIVFCKNEDCSAAFRKGSSSFCLNCRRAGFND